MNLAFKYIQNQDKQQVNQQQLDKDIIKKIEDFEIDEENEDRATYDNLVDILFVIDTTGSMEWCINECKRTILHIIENFTKQEFNLKFALECYRDHPPQENTYIEQHTDLSSPKEIILTLQNTFVSGGGDTPEAVMDGLHAGLKKTSWRLSEDKLTQSKRFLFHICDAPPHGKEYGQTSSDKQWQEHGCPCGITKEDIAKMLNDFNVNYHLVKCDDILNQMEQIFKLCFKDKFCDTINVQKNVKTQTSHTYEFHKEVVNKISKKLF